LRGARDVELETISKPTLESARVALERKAKIYEKLQKGKTGGLNDKQYEALLVDVRATVLNIRFGRSNHRDASSLIKKQVVSMNPIVTM
jgi:hypothetical protein